MMAAPTNGMVADRDPASGKFLPGNRGGGRPVGSKDKQSRLRDLILDHALGRTEDGKIRAVDTLERVREEDPTAYLKLVSSTLPKNPSPRATTGGLTLAALIQVLDQQPAKLIDARVIESPVIAAVEPVDEKLLDSGDDDDPDPDDGDEDPDDDESEN